MNLRIALALVLLLFLPFFAHAQADKEIIWQVNSNVLERIISDAAISHVGDRVTVVFQDGLDDIFQEYHANTGRVLSEYKFPASSPSKVRYSADDKEIVFGWDGLLQYWNIEGKKLGLSHGLADGFITSMETTLDGKYVITGTSKGFIQLWKYGNSNVYKEYEASSGKEITAITPLIDKGAICFAVGNDIYSWNFENNQQPVLLFSTQSTSTESFVGIGYDQAHNVLNVVADSLYSYNFSDNKKRGHLYVPQSTISGTYDYNAGLLYLSIKNWSTLKVYIQTVDLATNDIIETRPVFDGDFKIYSVAGADKLLARYDFTSIGLYDVKQKRSTPFILPIQDITDARYYQKRDAWVFSSSAAQLLILNAKDRSIDTVYFNLGGNIKSFAIANKTGRILAGCYDHMLRIWDIEKKEFEKELNTNELPSYADVIKCQISDDGKFAYVIFTDSTMRVWDIDKDELINTYKSIREINALDISDKYIGINADGTAIFFDISTGMPVDSFNTFSDGISFITDDVVVAPSAVYHISTQDFRWIKFGGSFTVTSDTNYAFFVWDENPVKIYDMKKDSVVYTYETFSKHLIFKDNSEFILLNDDQTELMVASRLGSIRLLKNMVPYLKTVKPEIASTEDLWGLNSTINPKSITWTSTSQMPLTADVSLYDVTGALLYESKIRTDNDSRQDHMLGFNPVRFPNGMYTISIRSTQGSSMLKCLFLK